MTPLELADLIEQHESVATTTKDRRVIVAALRLAEAYVENEDSANAMCKTLGVPTARDLAETLKDAAPALYKSGLRISDNADLYRLARSAS